ncbi:MAG: cation-transporting P-type ATPase [Rhodospirillaceae bacterium]|nr:cation-transporting P-type ATPase [Rhodospirillaceae bacterium]
MAGKIQNIEKADVFTYLNSRDEGLSAAEVEGRLAELGRNTLEAPRGLWWLSSLIRQFTNFFSILLMISAGICFVAHFLQPGESMNILGWALLGVSVLNALFSFVQEFRAERAMEELKKFLPQRVMAVRAGEEAEVAADQLVPGDIIVLREGDRVPADVRMVESRDLVVNNAPLTGESIPLSLTAEAVDKPLTESENLAFAGCAILRGSGRGVVFATGFRSQFGRIAMLSRDIKRTVSPLERETAHMVRVLTIIAVTMGLIFFAYGVATERSLWVNLVFMMGIIVANVPEGLLPTFTLSLAMGSLRMAKRNVLVKSLNAVEALGAVHVICTDKTGTLTMNRLSVTRIEAAGDAGADVLQTALAACDLDSVEDGWSGDPLDEAIAVAYQARGDDAQAVLDAQSARFPFDVEKRREAAVCELPGGTVFAVKGAWESIRPLLRAQEALLQASDAKVDALAAEGYRVIAVAGRRLAEGEVVQAQAAAEHDLELAGFLGLEDPLRPEVAGAVQQCHTAGIGTIMITGDHPITAEAIARQAGMIGADVEHGAATVTGAELSQYTEAQLVESLRSGVRVFARATPEQKMKIVNALHQMDRVVAVTGDGVNDAPALKAADVGIAMGRDGTDVAREAAQVVLLDDNFASIVAGIEEGRTIFANIQKFTNYVLVSNGPEILPYLLYMLFPVPLALTVIQILTIDLGTDIIPSMGLGQEKPDAQTMKEKPRSRNQGLLTLPLIAHSYGFLGLIEAAFSMSLFFWVLFAGGWQWGVELASNDTLYRSATGIALSSILLMQIGNLFGRRSRTGSGLDRRAFSNPLIVIGIVFEAVFSWAILYVPMVNTVLGTAPVDIQIYLVAWLGVPLIFGLDYLRKLVFRRFVY